MKNNTITITLYYIIIVFSSGYLILSPMSVRNAEFKEEFRVELIVMGWEINGDVRSSVESLRGWSGL